MSVLQELAEIGIHPVINACGPKSLLGGNPLRDSTIRAMNEVNGHCFDLVDMNKKLSHAMANLLEVEACHIVAGAASGMFLAAAATLSQWKQAGFEGKTTFLSYVGHQGQYGYIYELSGAKTRLYGNMNGCSRGALESAIDDSTAAITYLLGQRIWNGGLSLQEVASIARQKGIPLIVDAAAYLPPVRNLKDLALDGVSYLIFSGGKDIRGPQNSGLVIGRSTAIARLEAECSPHLGVGRISKVTKEAMVGLYAALQHYLREDPDQKQSELVAILRALKARTRPDLQAKLTIVHDQRNYFVPHLVFDCLDSDRGKEIIRSLVNRVPPVKALHYDELGHIAFSSDGLRLDEVEEIGNAISEVIK